MVAVRVPLAVGLKTTLAEQLAFVVRLVPQVLLLMAKSPAFVPPIATLLIVMVELVPLVRVAVCAPLVDPTAVAGKPSDVGETVTPPLVVLPPVPERATVWGLLVAVSEMLSVAERVPVAVGLKEIEIPQLADVARLDPQLLLEMMKSAALVPEIAMLLIVIEELLPFMRVVFSAELVDPTFIDPKDREVGFTVTVPLVPPGA